MYDRELPEQLLLTFSLVLIIGDVIRLIWGVSDRSVSFNIEPLEMFGTFINPYQFVVIGLGLAVALGLWAFLKFTRYGRIVCAAVHSREMVSALGIRIRLIYAGVFALGLGSCGARCRCVSAYSAYGAGRRHRSDHPIVCCSARDRWLRQRSRHVRRIAYCWRRVCILGFNLAEWRTCRRFPYRR